jgi:hypothetical protein
MIWVMLPRLIALGAALLLGSCIDSREEIWLEADGSGRAEISYSLPANAAKLQGGEAGIRKLIGEFLAHTPALKSSSYEVTTTDTRTKIEIKLTFDSALNLKDISSSDSMKKLPSSAADLAGNLNVKIHGRTVDFTRHIAAASALPGARFMPTSSFDGRRLIYIMHLPTAATSSNATRTENADHTLIWDFPLAQAIKAPITTHFTMPIPIPTSLIATTTAIILLAGWLLHLAFRRRSHAK